MKDFCKFMEARGMCNESIRVYSTRLEGFLAWALPRCEKVSAISIRDVDEYLGVRQLNGCMPRTIATFCTTLRLSFCYAEMRGLNDCKIARGIRNPRFQTDHPAYKRLPWKQVRGCCLTARCLLGLRTFGLLRFFSFVRFTGCEGRRSPDSLSMTSIGSPKFSWD